MYAGLHDLVYMRGIAQLREYGQLRPTSTDPRAPIRRLGNLTRCPAAVLTGSIRGTQWLSVAKESCCKAPAAKLPRCSACRHWRKSPGLRTRRTSIPIGTVSVSPE